MSNKKTTLCKGGGGAGIGGGGGGGRCGGREGLLRSDEVAVAGGGDLVPIMKKWKFPAFGLASSEIGGGFCEDVAREGREADSLEQLIE